MSDPDNLMLIEGAENVRLSPTMGVAMIALNMALKYHDINTVQDGALYQQYKLEGKNMHSLHLEHVFETARQIERHLLTSSHQIAEMMVSGVMEVIQDLAEEEDDGDGAERVHEGKLREEPSPSDTVGNSTEKDG